MSIYIKYPPKKNQQRLPTYLMSSNKWVYLALQDGNLKALLFGKVAAGTHIFLPHHLY